MEMETTMAALMEAVEVSVYGSLLSFIIMKNNCTLMQFELTKWNVVMGYIMTFAK